MSFKSDVNKFDNLIKELEGKVVYVDVWASWCAPCRKEISHSKKIIKKYENKNLVVIFLSIDGDYKKWEKASTKENIKDYKYNIGFINMPNSEKLKNLRIRSIPHYLIFNKKGDLVNIDAPNPSEKDKLYRELDKYLAE
jgi:thiol-disulfide isomerase/thioredoxin